MGVVIDGCGFNPSECDLTVHRKCEQKVIGDCPMSAAVPTIMADEPVVVSSGVRLEGAGGRGGGGGLQGGP